MLQTHYLMGAKAHITAGASDCIEDLIEISTPCTCTYGWFVNSFRDNVANTYRMAKQYFWT